MTEGCRPSWPGRDDGRLARLGGVIDGPGITHPSPDGESLLVGLAFCALGWRGESRALRTEPIAVRFLGCLRGENGELATAESAGLHAGKVRGTGEHRQGARQWAYAVGSRTPN